MRNNGKPNDGKGLTAAAPPAPQPMTIVNKKRLFQVLDEMNVADIANDTKNVGVYNTMLNVDANDKTGLVTMGVSAQDARDLALKHNKTVVLLIIDLDIYNELSK